MLGITEGSYCYDVAMHTPCCACCALCQEVAELRHRTGDTTVRNYGIQKGLHYNAKLVADSAVAPVQMRMS